MSDEKIFNEKGYFFNEEQRKVKVKIINNLMDGFLKELYENRNLFKDNQSVSDLFGSILVMFNREIILYWLMHVNQIHNRKDIIKSLFECIKEEINKKLREITN